MLYEEASEQEHIILHKYVLCGINKIKEVDKTNSIVTLSYGHDAKPVILTAISNSRYIKTYHFT